MNKKMFFLITLMFILAGCSGSGTGIAPSHDTIVSDQPSSDDVDHVFKYGESVETVSGWEVVFDSSDSVENIVLASGWEVEAVYE